MSGAVHVTPIGDEREHDLTPWCWCGPTADDDDPDALPVYVHNSVDMREEYERATGEGLCGKPRPRTTTDDETDEA